MVVTGAVANLLIFLLFHTSPHVGASCPLYITPFCSVGPAGSLGYKSGLSGGKTNAPLTEVDNADYLCFCDH